MKWCSAFSYLCFGSLLALTNLDCSSRDCAVERQGQTRCVGNRVETCTVDGQLEYEGCAARGLVCSETLGACVTAEVAMATSTAASSGSGGGGGGGNGGSSSANSGGSSPASGTGGNQASGGAGGSSGGNGGAGGQ